MKNSSKKATKPPLVSVVVPCYNLGEFIGEAVDSVKAQTIRDWELIIVDDGSTDADTIKVLKSIKTNKSLKIIRQKNQGLCAARNTGVSASKGTYVVCLDADDKLEPTYIEECLKIFQTSNDKQLAIVTTWLKEFGEREDAWRTKNFDPIQLLIGNQIHAASMYKKEVWEEVGGYNKIMLGGYEDWEFWLNIVKHGYKWATVPHELFRYRIRSGSMLSGSEQKNGELYGRIYSLHKTFFEENFGEYVHAMNKTLKNTRSLYQDKSDRLGKVTAEADTQRSNHEAIASDLNAKLFKATHELGELKNSRLIRAAINVRKVKAKSTRVAKHTLGRAKRIPRKVIHATRVVVAPYIPPKARKIIKRGYRKARAAIRKPTIIIPVANQPWYDNRPMVSIVIPYYNLGDTVDDTLASLQQQTYKNFEVIIINDGSTNEGSSKKFTQLNTKGLKVKLVDQENQGVAAARNNGLKIAQGKYLMCLDADDMLQATFLEKTVIYLETHPDCDLVNCHVAMFGVENKLEERVDYDPTALIDNNMVITAAIYRREAWEHSGGYKTKIGYEDWDYWLTLAENGYWGDTIHEPLFLYRTAGQSRYLEDKTAHHDNIRTLRGLHRGYSRKIKSLTNKKKYESHVVTRETALINLKPAKDYSVNEKDSNVLVAIPWMTFGGAETLIYNFCRELKKTYDISFITGLPSEHEWEWKFKEITPNIYHLANLFDTQELYLDFISLYIETRNIKLIHIIHTSFMFPFLAELKKRHPDVKVVATMFNDRAEHFELSVQNQDSIDTFSTDNQLVADHYRSVLSDDKTVARIPNGINCYDDYNPEKFDRETERQKLGIGEKDTAVFFIGRLSEEKNPDVFLEVAEKVSSKQKNSDVKTKFFVIGDGQMRGVVEKMVRKIDSPDVTYLGYKAYVGSYLSAADIFVLPSSVEGFPLSILEAMAMKVVVVASRVGAVPDVIESGKNGIIVRPGDAEEMTEAVEYLASNPREREAMKAVSREAVEGIYSNTLLGKNYRKLYKETLSR